MMDELALFERLPLEKSSIDSMKRGYLSLKLSQQLKNFKPSLILLYGGTGVGKSSLLNSLFQVDLAKVSALRPSTRQPLFLVHPQHEKGMLDLLNGASLPYQYDVRRCEDELLLQCAVIDAPDYDSLELKNQEIADSIFRFSDLVVLVTSPAKYGDELTQLALKRAQQYGKSVIGVMNKWDSVQETEQSILLDSFQTIYSLKPFPYSSLDSNGRGGLRNTILSTLPQVKRSQQVERQRHEFNRELQFQLAKALDDLQRDQSLFESIQSKLDEIHEKFWQRHQLVQADMEKGLRNKLAKIAEEKVFYLSKFVTKTVMSIIPGFRDETGGDHGGQWAQAEYDLKIRENLILALRESHIRLQEELIEHRNLSFRCHFDLEQTLAEFDRDFASFREQTYSRITKTFQDKAQGKHSIMAVSQEVLLSLVFYSLLGPIGLLPGWEQVLSGLCYLVYGKLPANALPSVMIELEDLSKDCKQEFYNFLKQYLMAPTIEFSEALTSLEDRRKDFMRTKDSLLTLEMLTGV